MSSDDDAHESDLASLVVSDTDSDDFLLSIRENKFIKALYDESALFTQIDPSMVDLADSDDCMFDLSEDFGKLVDVSSFIVNVSEFVLDLNKFVSDLTDFVRRGSDLNDSKADDEISEANENPSPIQVRFISLSDFF
ncbi:hypothetical protein ACS0TY_005698 [Phlomoides rotata]